MDDLSHQRNNLLIDKEVIKAKEKISFSLASIMLIIGVFLFLADGLSITLLILLFGTCLFGFDAKDNQKKLVKVKREIAYIEGQLTEQEHCQKPEKVYLNNKTPINMQKKELSLKKLLRR